MAKNGNIIAGLLIAIFAVAVVSIFAISRMSVTSQPATITSNQLTGGVVSAELYGKDATVSVGCYNVEADTLAQVADTVYYWVNGDYIGTATCNASARVDISDAVVGDEITLTAFDATYPYAEVKTLTVGKQNENVNINVNDGATIGSVTISVYDDSGDKVTNMTGVGVTVGSTNYIIEKVRIENGDDKSLIKIALIGFDYAENTNITEFRMSGASRFTGSVRKSGARSVEDWFVLEADLNDDMTRIDTGAVTIVPNGENINAETVTIYVMDRAPFITSNNQLAYGYENDANSPVDVGIADKTQALLLA